MRHCIVKLLSVWSLEGLHSDHIRLREDVGGDFGSVWAAVGSCKICCFKVLLSHSSLLPLYSISNSNGLQWTPMESNGIQRPSESAQHCLSYQSLTPMESNGLQWQSPSVSAHPRPFTQSSTPMDSNGLQWQSPSESAQDCLSYQSPTTRASL